MANVPEGEASSARSTRNVILEQDRRNNAELSIPFPEAGKIEAARRRQ